MVDLAEVSNSISRMTNSQLLEHFKSLREIRRELRIESKKPTIRKTRPKTERKNKPIDINSMTPDFAKQLLAQLENLKEN
jgi:hypothetical protein